MTWGLRVATNSRRGAGHVARCAALAEALGRDEVVFFCDPDNPHLERLRPVVSNVIEERADACCNRICAALRDGRLARAILDSYDVRDEDVAEIAHLGFTAAFRDAAPYGAEHISIDLGLGAIDGERVIAGPDYVPLRAGFARARDAAVRDDRICPGARLHILIGFGALDSDNLTGFALDALAHSRRRPRITVMMASGAAHLDAVGARVARLDGAELVVGAPAPEALYLAADLAIGSPGISQLERMCCGLPTVLIAQNPTHAALARQWRDQGAASTVLRDPVQLSRAIERLVAVPATLRAMRVAGLDLVDGRGAGRLASALTEKARTHRR